MKKKAEIKKYDANILENIGRDGDFYSLNDLWVIAGSPDAKRPNDWKNTQQGSDFIVSACRFLNAAQNGIFLMSRKIASCLLPVSSAISSELILSVSWINVAIKLLLFV